MADLPRKDGEIDWPEIERLVGCDICEGTDLEVLKALYKTGHADGRNQGIEDAAKVVFDTVRLKDGSRNIRDKIKELRQ